MYFNCSICIIRSSDTIFPLNYIVQGIVELAFEEKKITPISVNGSQDVSFPETYNPMVCEICNGTEAELFILYEKGMIFLRLVEFHYCVHAF